MSDTTEMRDVWEQYTATWRMDPTERITAFAACLVDDCTYTDPNVRTTDLEALSSYMDGFQDQVPGGGFVTRSFTAHHDSVLVHWDMLDADDNPLSPGTSVGVFDPDGRLRSMTGFFG